MDVHCIIIYTSKTVNILNAHPNKEMLPFLSMRSRARARTHTCVRTRNLSLLASRERSQLAGVKGRRKTCLLSYALLYHLDFISATYITFHIFKLLVLFLPSFTSCYIFPSLCQFFSSFISGDV